MCYFDESGAEEFDLVHVRVPVRVCEGAEDRDRGVAIIVREADDESEFLAVVQDHDPRHVRDRVRYRATRDFDDRGPPHPHRRAAAGAEAEAVVVEEVAAASQDRRHARNLATEVNRARVLVEGDVIITPLQNRDPDLAQVTSLERNPDRDQGVATVARDQKAPKTRLSLCQGNFFLYLRL